jgi:uncharacterized membrane protein YeaQ/YmgE (transglycosylase-associated protein family)
METLAQMLVSLVCGGVCGNIIVTLFLKKFSLGIQGNTMLGLIGGFLGVQLFGSSGSIGPSVFFVATLAGSALICIVGFFWNFIATMAKVGQERCPHCQISDICGSGPRGLREELAIVCHRYVGHCRRHRPLLVVPTLQNATTLIDEMKSIQRLNPTVEDEHRSA